MVPCPGGLCIQTGKNGIKENDKCQIPGVLKKERRRPMNPKLIEHRLTDPEGTEKPLGKWLEEAPYTALALYRGDW
jgi:hypothetical protein